MPPISKRARSARHRNLYLSTKGRRTTIHRRFRWLVTNRGGVTKFAREHKIFPKYVYRWYSDGVTPSTNYLLRFATVSKVSPEWLLLGNGDPYIK